MTVNVLGSRSRHPYDPCRCDHHRPCPPLPPGPPRTTGAAIPFSISQFGSELTTDNQGNPQIVAFSGFGVGYYGNIFLADGEWNTGTITFRPDMAFGSSFIMPYNAVLRNIEVLFSTQPGVFFEGAEAIRPFACIAVSNSPNLVYTILQDTITYTEPYGGNFEYPKHTLRRGSLRGLNIPIYEGSLVAIVAGIRGENVIQEQFGAFSVSGGIFLE